MCIHRFYLIIDIIIVLYSPDIRTSIFWFRIFLFPVIPKKRSQGSLTPFKTPLEFLFMLWKFPSFASKRSGSIGRGISDAYRHLNQNADFLFFFEGMLKETRRGGGDDLFQKGDFFLFCLFIYLFVIVFFFKNY